MYEALWNWCRGMTAWQVNFFMNGALLLAAASFVCLLFCGWTLIRRKRKIAAIAGGGMALTALISWIFLSLVLMQSGKMLPAYYVDAPIIPLTYVIFSGAGVTAVIVCLLRRNEL